MIAHLRLWTALPLLALLTSCTTTYNAGPTRRSFPPAPSNAGGFSSFPVPKGNVAITIERTSYLQTDRSVIDAALKYRGEKITVKAGGLDVYQPTEGFAAAIRVGKQQSRHSRSSQQMIMGMPGTTSNLQVLEISQQPWTTVIPLYNGAVIVEEFREEITGSGLTVNIVRAGASGIELDLTPYFNRHRQKGVIKVNELTTRVTVQPGVPIAIMSDAGSNNSVNTGILSRHSQKEQHETLIVLTARM